jgi:D-alanyl-D-alanine carboxypeptidase/D-alanyl-D-alanine-endopeptidase (penicillin-binding protein 4)
MQKYYFLFALLITFTASAQTIPQRLTAAVKQFQSDPQMRHAIMSLCVIDAKTGKKVYAHNDQIGLAPASTQKIFTSAAAFELLGSDYSYKTELALGGKVDNGILKGHLYIKGKGDPTLGSWRYVNTKEEQLLNNWVNAVKAQKIQKIEGGVFGYISGNHWPTATIPDGWTWQDIGNYYGAGAGAINWRENQYDLVLRSGDKTGDRVHIVTTRPKLFNIELQCEVTTGAKNSGDNAYIYLPTFSTDGVVRGTIPPGEKEFVISGAFPNPITQLGRTLSEKLGSAQIVVKPFSETSLIDTTISRQESFPSSGPTVIATHHSPPLDSINYYFMRRSINLYGEALIKTIGLEKVGSGDTEKGIDVVKDFWSAKGIEKSAIQIIDGSGLSPQNRVTTDAEVKALQYARSRSWFQSFYQSLPEYNDMKMKSGSIGGARAYAGYHTAKDGKTYTFSIIVNNYDGSAGEIVRKIYRVLDVLK